MTNAKSTKRALLGSALSLLLCFTMLLSTTFAWFTDTVTSANNIIQAGNLDVEMYWADGTKAVPTADNGWTDASSGAIFYYDKWEPGYVEVRHIKIANEGNLALQYKVGIAATGEVSDLADVIDVYYVDPAVQVADRAALTEDKKLGTLTQVLANLGESGTGKLLPDEAHTITIALKMQETAGNEYMKKSIGSSFAVQLLATQLAAEFDSFDNQYDKDSEYPTVSAPAILPEDPVDAEEMNLATENTEVKLPVGAVKNIIDGTTEAKSVAVHHSAPVYDEVNNTVTFDSFELVDESGKVIDLETMGNTEDITVKMYVKDFFAVGTHVAIYHDAEFIGYAEVDGQGYITYTAKHFCEIVIFDPAAELKDALAAGGNVVLTNDVIISESLPVTQDTVLDLNGKKIGTSGSTTGSPLYLQSGKLTVKNGTLDLDGSHTNVNGTFSVAIGYDAQTELVVENVNFTGKTAINGTFATDGPLKIAISDCTMDVTSVGIAVSANSTDAVATITNCNIDADEYAIFASQGSKITINGGTYKSAGKVITSMYDNTVVTINGGTFDGELWVTDGGSLVIYGGTFTADPSAYVANGYIATQNADGTYTVVEGVAVANAADLKAAFAAGGNIVLTQDIAITNTLMTTKDVVIDLNGKAITAPANGNMFQSQSNASPDITITSSVSGAEINVSGGDTAVLLGYGSTEIKNVTINVTGCDNYSPSPFNVYGDLTIGEGTVVNVDYLGSALINNNGKVAISIDGAQFNIGKFKRNGFMIDRNNATTFEMKNTTMKINEYVLSQFGGEGLINKIDGVTIENCTFDITDSNGVSCTFVADAGLGRYDLVQK